MVAPDEQAARDQDLRKANALLGHWMGGINPCTCWRCQDVAAALREAREEAVRMERARLTPLWEERVRMARREERETLEAALLHMHEQPSGPGEGLMSDSEDVAEQLAWADKYREIVEPVMDAIRARAQESARG